MTRFEDLLAWQKGRILTACIYRVSREGQLARDYGLASQMQRAAVSIMSNIAEGFERRRPAEFIRFLAIAKSSCAELHSQLYVALDTGYLDENTFHQLVDQAEEVARIVSGLRTSIERRQDNGSHSSLPRGQQ